MDSSSPQNIPELREAFEAMRLAAELLLHSDSYHERLEVLGAIERSADAAIAALDSVLGIKE